MSLFRIEDIIYEDEDIIVAKKHAKMAVQSAKSSQLDMESAIRNYISSQSAKSEMPYVGIIQRLDQPVEGVIVFAKNPGAAKALNYQMQQNQIEKRYLVATEGQLKDSEGKLEDFLLRDGRTNTSKVVNKGTNGSKQAILFYKVRQTKDNRHILEVRLQTGRHHQIRVQLANAKMPIIGDKKYNPEDKSSEQLALCAYSLKFRHPSSNQEMKFEVVPENTVYNL